jgi:hypothetical protein
VVGNAYHGFLTGKGRLDVVIVSAVPAVALGALVHLAVLVGRRPVEDEPEQPRPDPWAALTDDVLAEPWERTIRAWSAPVDAPTDKQSDPVDWPAPPRSEPSEVLAADLRAVDAARQSAGLPPLSRDGIVSRYGTGGPRSKKIRELADRMLPAAPAANHRPGDERLDEPVGRTNGEQLDAPVGSGRERSG